MKQKVSLREANQHLSRYVEAVERGEEVVITRRGVPVAKIVRIAPGERLTKAQKAARVRGLTAAQIARAAGHEVLGADAGVYPHGLNARQFAYMVRYGMTPMILMPGYGTSKRLNCFCCSRRRTVCSVCKP